MINLKKNIFKVLILTLILIIVSFVIIVIKGDTYNLKIKTDDVYEVEIDNKIIKVIDEKYDNGYLYLKIKGLKKGNTSLIVNDYMEIFYVHNFNIITKNSFFGKSSGDIVILISIIIILLYINYLMIKKYIRCVRNNLYMYKNIFYLGLIFFLVLFLINQVYGLFSYNGLIYSIRSIIEATHMSFILLPVILIIFIVVTISNIKLLIKEGLSFKNMLGVFLGIILCFLTLLPDIMYQLTYNDILISTHNQNSISYYVYMFIETTIYTLIMYLECILFGTIVIAIKAAYHMPKRDKDYIIILGCKIRSDGSLTPLLKSRVDKALEFYNLQMNETGKKLVFIPSGGKGSDEVISEAVAIKNYLVEKGINENQILIEDKSKNTYENIKNSYKLINKKDVNIAYSTTGYHVFRAGIIATKQNIQLEGIGSKTKPYFYINAFIREFIATLYSERRKHIFVLITILVISLIMIFIMSIN